MGTLNLFDAVVSAATQLGWNPLAVDDTPPSVQLRQNWWNRIAQPPPGSGYEKAAWAAKIVTGQRCTTIADRDAFKAAMIEALR